MLVDTGATISLISSSFLASLPKGDQVTLLSSPQENLRTVAGDTVPVEGVATVCLSIAGHEFRRAILVANIRDHCILGYDFMKEYNCVLNLRDGTLLLGDRQLVLRSCRDPDADPSYVVCRRTVTVPPYAQLLIPGRMSSGQAPNVCVVEPCAEGPPSAGLMVARGLVHHGEGAVPVRVLNATPSPIVLQRGQRLGQCSQVVEIQFTEERAGDHAPPPAAMEHNTSLLHYIDELIEGSQPPLTQDQAEKARALFQEFRDVFSFSAADLGRTTAALHHIDTGTASPIKQAPRRLPLASFKEVDKLISDMRDQDVIEPSSSPWASPIVLVKKKDGSTRFCVDYRRLNNVTKKDSYPLPRIDDALHALAGAAWFSTLDLRSGYWQVEVAPEDKEQTAFTTGRGLWQFKVMPFGLCNAPATF
ncbi:uncharacterized protein LOC135392173 [Ornithodoros turicata]|uniref:uncharacterized protein LOC135392173 n=1 Tax=Ornithodoros turicata TaxID=34597 RepID=UPI003139ED4C